MNVTIDRIIPRIGMADYGRLYCQRQSVPILGAIKNLYIRHWYVPMVFDNCVKNHFLLYFLNAREPLLSIVSRVFKKYTKKVLFDKVIKYHLSPQPLYIGFHTIFKPFFISVANGELGT